MGAGACPWQAKVLFCRGAARRLDDIQPLLHSVHSNIWTLLQKQAAKARPHCRFIRRRGLTGQQHSNVSGAAQPQTPFCPPRLSWWTLFRPHCLGRTQARRPIRTACVSFRPNSDPVSSSVFVLVSCEGRDQMLCHGIRAVCVVCAAELGCFGHLVRIRNTIALSADNATKYSQQHPLFHVLWTGGNGSTNNDK